MQIVIDLREGGQHLPGGACTLEQLFLQWALQNPTDEFVWLSERSGDLPDLPNLKIESVAPIRRNTGAVIQGYRREWSVLSKKFRPDWLIPVPGVLVRGLDVPQAAFWLHAPGRHFLEKSLISRFSYKRMLPEMIQLARIGWLNGDGWRTLLPHKQQLELSNWQALAPVAAPESNSRVNEAALYEMDYHTGGRPFFASFVTSELPETTMQLMKSFSVFKKRQQTDWKLLLIAEKNGNYRELKRAMDAYKYKEDTVLLEATTAEKNTVLNLAYALVQGAGQLLNDSQLLMALQHACPLLLPDKYPPQDWLGDTAVYAGSEDVSEIAGLMMRVYKDEEFRRERCQASGALYRSLSLEQLAQHTYRLINPRQ